jgi:hypothetical protein
LVIVALLIDSWHVASGRWQVSLLATCYLLLATGEIASKKPAAGESSNGRREERGRENGRIRAA